MYDPATDKWIEARQPAAHAVAPQLVDVRLQRPHLRDGRRDVAEQAVEQGQRVRPGPNKWTDSASLPGSRTSGEAGVINGVLYFSGGRVDDVKACSAELVVVVAGHEVR